MIHLRPQSPDDIAHVVRNMRAADLREAMAIRYSPDIEELVADLVALRDLDGLCLTASDEKQGEAIALLCMWQTGKPGVASAGMIATDKFCRIGFGVTRWLKREGFPKIIDKNFRRQECRVMEDHIVARAWLKSLGFRQEGRHPGDGNNRECYLSFGRLAQR